MRDPLVPFSGFQKSKMGPDTHESHILDYSRHLVSYRFVYCKRVFPTLQSQESRCYRIPNSLHSPYRRLCDLDVTPLCWPIAVALASFRDYGRVSHSLWSSTG